MTELKILQAVRLKGRVTPADVASTVGVDQQEADDTIEALTSAGFLVMGKALKLTPEGKARLVALLDEERVGVDTAVIAETYDEFRAINGEFKELISDWQLKDGQPNSHEDAAYDAEVLGRLDGIHERVKPIVATAAGEIPRLSSYSTKLDAALEKVRAGETTWLTRPIIDSYHTVWFELHEELIQLAGLTREDEARAGHAE